MKQPYRLALSAMCALGIACVLYASLHGPSRETKMHADSGTSSPSVPDMVRSAANLEVSRTSPEFTVIRLESPQIQIQKQPLGIEECDAFSIAGEPLIPEEGSPTVPQVSRFYRIPNTGGVEMIVTEAEYDVIPNIYPLPFSVDQRADQMRERNAAVYDSDAWYPRDVAQISEPMILRDFRVVTVTLYPVQVNPVTRQARVYRRLEVHIVSNDEPAPNELTVMRRPSGAWLPVYRSVIPNLDEMTLNNATTTPGSYLILCKSDQNARQWADSLFEWKTRSGFKVMIDARASWSATTMVTAIQTAYANWDPPLEYVTLIGDPQSPDGVPTSYYAYDHAFALGNAGDELEDISVGRLSGEALSQMAVINTKIMGYERTPFMTDTTWFRNGLFYCGVSDNVASNWTLMQWGAQQFQEWTGVNHDTAAYINGSADIDLLAQWFRNGLSFFFWRGSNIGELSNTIPPLLPSGWKLPVCVIIGAMTGDFTQSNSVAESFLTAGFPNEPRGGVAAIGFAGTTSTAPSVTMAGGIMYAIANLGIENLGTALSTAKLLLSLAYAADQTTAVNYSRATNLLGEPSLSMWTDVPVAVDVTYPALLNVGSREVRVAVTRQADSTALSDALVVLWKRGSDSIYVRGLTDDSGRVTLPVRVKTSGGMMLTVTKRGHVPFLVTIPCVSAPEMTMYSSYTLDDDNTGGTSGNGDHIINPGEVVDMPVVLRNFGTTDTATGITAHLSSNNDRVQVLQSDATYSDLAPGDSAVGIVPFRFQVDPMMQNGEPVQLELDITSQAGTTRGCIELICASSELEYESQTFSTPLNPGSTCNLQVAIRNVGTVAANGVVGQLVSLDPYITIVDGSATYGNITAGAMAANTTDAFTVTASLLAFRGRQSSLLLVTTTDIGHEDTTQFSVHIGTAVSTDPTGPDAYGYYAYDNTDTSYFDSLWTVRPEFQYVDISSGSGEDLNLDDIGEKTTITQVWSTARPLPFPFKFYGVVYDTITVCANGWLAFGNQAWNDVFRNYPIPGMQAPDAMIAPYWDDLRTSGTGLGVWMYNDTQNHRFIVQWKAGAGTGYGTRLDFEVILYDTTSYPTMDNNGLILVQYNDVVMNLPDGSGSFDLSGSTVGIQAPRGLVGLGYVFQNAYAPGAATIQAGRAILYTTNGQSGVGSVAGVITDAETSLPIAGAELAVEGWGFLGLTDSAGAYLLSGVPAGIRSATANAHRYNSSTAEVTVGVDSTTQMNFSLTHPEIALSTDSISADVADQPTDTTFDIINDGNGPLDYTISIGYPGNPSPWDSIGAIAVSEITGDYQIMGCEFVNGNWWVTGGNVPGGQNMFYRFDRDGVVLPPIPQPTTSAVGWFDLAYDGQYVYGSDGSDLVGVDLAGVVRATIPTPTNPARAVAYDAATDHFWVGDYFTDIFEIDRAGVTIQQIPNSGTGALGITGLAWNPTEPDGYKLYLFGWNGDSSQTRVSRLNPVTLARETVIDLPGRPGDRAGGCTITPAWNSMILVFGAILQNVVGDRLQIHEMAMSTTWIRVAPVTSQIPANSFSSVMIHFDPAALMPDIYHANLQIASQVLDTTVILPIRLAVRDVDVPQNPSEVPGRYALYQNYPNPFNSATEIRFDLPVTARVELEIFNTMGQHVTTLAEGIRTAGAHRVWWDGTRFGQESVASGVYICRFKSGNFVDAKKMVLIR